VVSSTLLLRKNCYEATDVALSVVSAVVGKVARIFS